MRSVGYILKNDPHKRGFPQDASFSTFAEEDENLTNSDEYLTNSQYFNKPN
jgi:hypothetical protein